MSPWDSLIAIFFRHPLIISSVCRQLSIFFSECLGFFWIPICTLSCSCSYSASSERLMHICWSAIRKVFFALQVQKFFLVYGFARWQVWKEFLKGCLCRSKDWTSESRKEKGLILHRFYCKDLPGRHLKMYILSIVCLLWEPALLHFLHLLLRMFFYI